MGLKIIIPIGTDKGITEEAYVRITHYALSKNGHVNLQLELFLNKAASQSPLPLYSGFESKASNQMVSNNHSFMLTKDVVTVVNKQRMIEKYDITGVAVHTEETYDEEVTSTVSDIASLESVNVFEFCYNSLKVRLEGVFGAGNIIND
tara:strand:+ start:86 stop:529 length:444 start_codon:yes stop_codon:yes gene_type:complete